MPREVDEKKTRKALRRLARAKRAAEEAGDEHKLSEWEEEFVESVGERLETYGSAFADLDKGAQDEALSALQNVKLREIEKKAKGKDRKPMRRRASFKSKGSGFKRKPPKWRSRDRDIHDDIEDAAPSAPDHDDADTRPPSAHPPALRVVKGGKGD